MLTISEVSKAYAGRVLFAEASLQVNREDRIGLVGPNGAGKSTLFALVLRQETPDTGKISIDRRMSVGYLPQECAPAGGETVLELAMAITPEVAALQRQLRAWETTHAVDTAEYHTAQVRFEELGGYGLEPRAKQILNGLGFRQSDFLGAPLSRDYLRKSGSAYVPSPNASADIDMTILELFHAGINLEEIARRVADRFPERFPEWNKALTRVGEMSRRYSR